MSKGYVYVLSNPSMSGIVKIGRSIHGGQGRADTFYKNDTGVPTPFVLEFEILVQDADDLELQTHKALSHVRVNKKREFFRVDQWEATAVIVQLAAPQIGIEVGVFPDVVSIEEDWNIYGSQINELLTSSGYQPVDKFSYAIEVSHGAYEVERLANSFKQQQDNRLRYKAKKPAEIKSKAPAKNTWELH